MSVKAKSVLHLSIRRTSAWSKNHNLANGLALSRLMDARTYGRRPHTPWRLRLRRKSIRRLSALCQQNKSTRNDHVPCNNHFDILPDVRRVVDALLTLTLKYSRTSSFQDNAHINGKQSPIMFCGNRQHWHWHWHWPPVRTTVFCDHRNPVVNIIL